MPAPERKPERPREPGKRPGGEAGKKPGAAPAAAGKAPAAAAPAAKSAAPGAAPGAGAGPDAAAQAPKPLSKEVIAQQINAKLPGYAEGAQVLADKLAKEQVNDTILQARLSNQAQVWSDLIAAWRGVGKDEGFVRQFGAKDLIAVQKFADIEAEAYLEARAKSDVTAEFYGKVAKDIQNTKTERSAVFPLMSNAAKGYTFLGRKIPEAQLTKISHRNHGVGSLFKDGLSAQGSAAIDAFAIEQVAKETKKTAAEVKAAGVVPDRASRLEALRHLLRTTYAGDPLFFADKSVNLSRYPTWYSPDQVRIDKADGNTAFTDLMTANALQPEWYADGALALEIEPTGTREARKPTAFDGMMSSLWMARNQPGQVYGVTGGGAREFLEKGITFGHVKKATAAIPSEQWVTELKRLSALVPQDSSVGEQVLRGKDPGTKATAPAYRRVLDRSQREAEAPTTVDGQVAPQGKLPIAKGGTFDPAGPQSGRTPAHARAAMEAPRTSPAAAKDTPPPAAPRAPGGTSGALPGTGGPGAPGSAAPSSPTGRPTSAGPVKAPAGPAAPAAAAPTAAAPTKQAAPAASEKPASVQASTRSAQAPVVAPPAPAGSRPAEAPAPSKAPRESKAPAVGAAPAAAGAPQAGAPAAKSAAPGATPAAGPAPVKPDALSNHAAGPAPAGWQGRVVAKVDAKEVHSDDAGHTYHVLADGKVVATSTPALVDASTTAAVQAKAGTSAAPATTGHDAALNADVAKVRATATLDEFDAMIQSMSVLVSAKNKASVNLRVTKLKAAIARTRPKLLQVYGPQKGAEYVKQWIDDKLPLAHAKPGRDFPGLAQTAKAKLAGSAAIDEAKQANAAGCLTNYAICSPEEPASDRMIEQSGGIMKVFDVKEVYWKGMAEKYRKSWEEVYGTEAAAADAFVAACKTKGSLVLAPPGKETDLRFAGLTAPAIYSNVINGFVGQAKDATQVGSYAEAIKRFQLNPDYYRSKAMFVCNAPPSAVKDKKNRGEIKIGKPSIFNILNFDENVYDENDREFGHLADPHDAAKPGTALELTCQGFPGSEFWPSARLLS